MKYEKEITVELDCNYENLMKILKENNFEIMEEYDINDIYMLYDASNQNKNEDELELLKKCVLIRSIIEENKVTNKITYKYKEYNEAREIIKQGKIDCGVSCVEDAKKLLEAIKYEELIRIFDHIIVCSNGKDEFAIEMVNNKHIYIEIEENCNFINKTYRNIDEMKEVIIKHKLPLKSNDFFVKKAEIELKEIKKSDEKLHR